MLTAKREAFAAGLAQGLSQAEAYRRAFPSSLAWKDASVWDKASKLAANVEVRQRVAELNARAAESTGITFERIAEELARLSLVDVRNLVDGAGLPRNIKDLDEDTARAVSGVEVVTVGNAVIGEGQVLKVKFADKGANLERLAKLLGYFEKDNRQKTPTELKLTMDADQFRTIAEAVAGKV
jgi:phage terminase small subunit